MAIKKYKNEDPQENNALDSSHSPDSLGHDLPGDFSKGATLSKPPKFSQTTSSEHLSHKTQQDHATSAAPTISHNHTLHGQIRREDVSDKGKNFDTTDVEMGKTQLHVVSQNLNKNYSNIDTSKLETSDVMDDSDVTKTRVNIIKSIKEMVHKKSIGPGVTNPDETRRIHILNTLSLQDRLKKYAIPVLSIVVIIFLVQSGVFSNKNKKDAIVSEEEFDSHLAGGPEAPSIKTSTKTKNSIAVQYNVKGRGLVYNCSEKFWACTDKSNYINCRKLSKKDKSCSPQGVFDSNTQCQQSLKSRSIAKVNRSICY